MSVSRCDLLEENDKKNVSLLINRVRVSLVKSGDMLNPLDMVSALSIPVIGVVPDEDDVLICANHGCLLSERKRSVAWSAYRNVAQRLLGESVPMLRLLQKEKFWKRKKYFFGHNV